MRPVSCCIQALAVLAVLLVAPQATLADPINPYYVIGQNWNLPPEDMHKLFLISPSGNQSWPLRDFCETAIALGATVRTYACQVGYGGGAEYTLDGAPTGTTYSAGLPGDVHVWDGATDGTHNYVVDSRGSGGVYRMGADWSNPQLLFTATPGYYYTGITYDASNQSLWLMGLGTMQEWSLTGVLLRDWGAVPVAGAALALDPADNTLWYYEFRPEGGGFFVQRSKSGAYLSEMHPSLPGYSLHQFFGGEILPLVIIPEPATALLALAGLAGLTGLLRRRARPR